MDEYRAPAVVAPDAAASITRLLADRVAASGDLPLIERRSGDDWTPMTARAFEAEVTAVAKGLVARGLEPGDKVILYPSSRVSEGQKVTAIRISPK